MSGREGGWKGSLEECLLVSKVLSDIADEGMMQSERTSATLSEREKLKKMERFGSSRLVEDDDRSRIQLSSIDRRTSGDPKTLRRHKHIPVR
jgi:hypothetical protein